MMLDLANLPWQVCGWRPFMWRLRKSMELNQTLLPDVLPIPARLPGSVQAALLNAGLIADPHIGMNSRLCEWVEHRQWEFFTTLPAMEIPSDARVTLNASGLDYSGWILLNGKSVAEFAGALFPHEIDLTPFLHPQQAAVLSIIFDIPPEVDGQIGFTSRTRHFKPRYNYSWDWCPRFVPIGISDSLKLQIARPALRVERVLPRLHDDLTSGSVTVHVQNPTLQSLPIVMELCDGATVIARQIAHVAPGADQHTMKVPSLEPWWPNGCHDANRKAQLYQLRLFAGAAENHAESAPIYETTIGFKQIHWLPCDGASRDAEPWICQINGESVFLQGINWTPVRMDYHGVTTDQYAHLIQLYKQMGCNVLRVWGGAFLEKPQFYDLCDQAGLLVWHEFPLSSSGVENWAPEDPAVIAHLQMIARSYIQRCGHHACRLLWCGGNELQSAPGKKTGEGLPLDLQHPCLSALAEIVHAEDPEARFIPTSPSGPSFCADLKKMGSGIHHDVHGPWSMDGDIAQWQHYWQKDDALFRSEVGLPSASPLSVLKKWSGDCSPWPVRRGNAYWHHAASWWMQEERFASLLKDCSEKDGLALYVQKTQELQAEGLALAAHACKSRFPKCGGFIVWMGHDCFPCPANTAIIDFEGHPKPAYFALQKVFQSALPAKASAIPHPSKVSRCEKVPVS